MIHAVKVLKPLEAALTAAELKATEVPTKALPASALAKISGTYCSYNTTVFVDKVHILHKDLCCEIL